MCNFKHPTVTWKCIRLVAAWSCLEGETFTVKVEWSELNSLHWPQRSHKRALLENIKKNHAPAIVQYNREHIQGTHSAREFVRLGQRLMNMYSREKHSELYNPETHSDSVINIQHIQSEPDRLSPHAIQWKHLKRDKSLRFSVSTSLSLLFTWHSTLFEASIVQGSFLTWGVWALTLMGLHASDFPKWPS